MALTVSALAGQAGAVVAVATMLVCVPYLWLRYFVLT